MLSPLYPVTAHLLSCTSTSILYQHIFYPFSILYGKTFYQVRRDWEVRRVSEQVLIVLVLVVSLPSLVLVVSRASLPSLPPPPLACTHNPALSVMRIFVRCAHGRYGTMRRLVSCLLYSTLSHALSVSLPLSRSVARAHSLYVTHTSLLACTGRDGARGRGRRAPARAAGHQGGMMTRAMGTRLLAAMPLPRRRNECKCQKRDVCARTGARGAGVVVWERVTKGDE